MYSYIHLIILLYLFSLRISIFCRSGEDIRPFYLNYQEAVDNKSKVDNSAESIDERDDFLCDHLEQPNDSKSFDKMLFGSSPGFKFRNDHWLLYSLTSIF